MTSGVAIDELRHRIGQIEGSKRPRRKALAFGLQEVDSRLPEGGLALGSLHEVAGGGNGAVDGAAAALFAAGIAARTKGKILWCITRPDLFAPAIAQAGLSPDRVIYVECGDEKSLLASPTVVTFWKQETTASALKQAQPPPERRRKSCLDQKLIHRT